MQMCFGGGGEAIANLLLTRSSQKRPDTTFLNLIIHLPPLQFAESWHKTKITKITARYDIQKLQASEILGSKHNKQSNKHMIIE